MFSVQNLCTLRYTVPGSPTIAMVETFPGGFNVTLGASKPYSGPANYSVTVTANGMSTSESVSI